MKNIRKIRRTKTRKEKASVDYAILFVLIALIVLFLILRLDKLIFNIILAKDENMMCVISASFNSMINIGGFTPIKLHCPRHLVTVVLTKKEADSLNGKNSDEDYFHIDEPIPPQQLKNVNKWYGQHWTRAVKINPNLEYIENDYFTGEKNKKHLYEYRLNEIVANEMKSCWNQLGRGEANFLSEWDSPIDVKKEELISPDVKDIGFGLIAAGVTALAKKKIGLASTGVSLGIGYVLGNSELDIKASKSQCVVCSRINYDDKVKNTFPYTQTNQVTSLPRWMQVHPVEIISKKPTSYYEFLIDESVPKDYFETGDDERYRYSTDKSYAVIYRRTSFALPVGFLNKAIIKGAKLIKLDTKDYESVGVDTVSLIPYERLYEECPAKDVVN